MKARTTVTSRNRTAVPAEIRRKYGLEPGMEVEWEDRGDHAVIRRVEAAPGRRQASRRDAGGPKD